MRTHRILALVLGLKLMTAFPADDAVLSSSMGRFAIEAFEQPVLEQVDLCTSHYPEIGPAFNTASAELRRRHRSLLSEALRSERFAALLSADVPQDLVLLYKQQSAMRRRVNTGTTRERCEQTLREFSGVTDQFLQGTIDQFLALTAESIRLNASSTAK